MYFLLHKKKRRRRNTGLFDTNEYFLFFQKTHFTYSTYLRIFFFFHFTKIVIIIYILFFLLNFSPPNKNERGTRDDSIFLFYASPQCLCTFLFSLFFSNRATRCNVSQRSQFRRKNEQRILSVDASEIPGKISHTALNISRSPRVRQRKREREKQRRYIVPRFYQRNVPITLVQKSNFLFLDSHFFESIRSSFSIDRFERTKGEKSNEEDADLSYAWQHLRLVRGHISPPESFPPAARKLVARFPLHLPLHPTVTNLLFAITF